MRVWLVKREGSWSEPEYFVVPEERANKLLNSDNNWASSETTTYYELEFIQDKYGGTFQETGKEFSIGFGGLSIKGNTP